MANYYNIKTKYENSIYERDENNYYVVKVKDIENQTAVDPDSIEIELENPCSTELGPVNMTKLSTGEYFYNIPIGAAAIYGEYHITVTASSPTYTTVFKDKFFVLPREGVYDVRRLSGITSKKSISDNDLAHLYWEAYEEARECVFKYHSNQTMKPNPDTGAWIDGTNTTFETKHGLLADHNGDGSVTGYGESSCATDVDGWWRDEDGDCHRVKITVNEAHCGNITVTQLDGSAIPSSAQWVKLNYYTEWYTYDSELFIKAVAYLAAHKAIIRFQELDKATMADLYSNREMISSHLKRMEIEYKKVMRKISRPKVGSAMKPGES